MAGLLALNVVVTMMLLMSIMTGEETRAGAIRYAAQEAAAVAASHLAPNAGFARQREAEEQAIARARRALFGICRSTKVEMVPSVGWGPWSSPQVAVEVICDPGSTRPKAARGLAWVPAG